MASKTEPKSKKKGWKCDAKKQCIFKSIFIGIFFALASENGMKIQCFLDLYRKSWFCENHCFSIRKLLFLWFRAPKNRPNFDVKTLSKMTSEKIALKSNSEGLKIHSTSSFKAILLQRGPSNLNFSEKLWFFNHFWLPKRR